MPWTRRCAPANSRPTTSRRADRRIDAVVEMLGIDGLRRHRIEVPAGGAVLAHYDLMHRGSRASPAFTGRRFMYKFYYFRTRDPEEPCWRNGAQAPVPPRGGTAAIAPTAGVVDTAWHWLRGDADWLPEVALDDQVERNRVCHGRRRTRAPRL